MIPLCDSWPKLPAWLKRRKTKEEQDMEEALRVAEQWGGGGECVETITAVAQNGEGIVLELERWLGVEHD